MLWLVIYIGPQLAFFHYRNGHEVYEIFLLLPLGLCPFFPPFGYLFYFGHLIYIFRVRNGKSFKIAVIILVIAVIWNLFGYAWIGSP